MIDVALVDTGLGNWRSVERALLRAASDLGKEARVTYTRDADAIARADRVVVPGQGAFRDCAGAIGGGLGDAIRASILRGAPYLGICLGLQILFGSSEEAPGCAGLGVFEGDVGKLPSEPGERPGESLKLPHVGWNTVGVARAHAVSVPSKEWFYFVHSFAVRPKDASIVLTTTTYGAPFVSAVAKDNVTAVQFHPEKSQAAGIALLGRFLAS
jgi:glutamine amidotransferase